MYRRGDKCPSCPGYHDGLFLLYKTYMVIPTKYTQVRHLLTRLINGE